MKAERHPGSDPYGAAKIPLLLLALVTDEEVVEVELEVPELDCNAAAKALRDMAAKEGASGRVLWLFSLLLLLLSSVELPACGLAKLT